jgi:hypothetical protein
VATRTPQDRGMSVKLRPGVPDDAAVCGQICYEAFGALAAAHGFPSDFPSAEVAIGLAGMMLGHPGFYSLVAEVDGQVVGATSWTNDHRSSGSDRSPSHLRYRTTASAAC